MGSRRLTRIVMRLAAVAAFALALVLPLRPAAAQDGCTELIANGGFEGAGGWVFGLDPAQPQYVTNPVHGGSRALQLGIGPGAPNQHSYSSARQQVTIPADASQVTLSFWYLSNMPGAPGTDYVEMALLAPDGRNLLDKPWRSFVDNRLWNGAAFDLTGWRGTTLQVYFNVYNSGTEPTSALYLDDVSLQACPGAAAASVTPTDTTTAEPTATDTLTPEAEGKPTLTMTPYPTAEPTWTLTPNPTLTPTDTPTTGGTLIPLVTLTPSLTPAYPPPQPGMPAGPPPAVAPPAPDCADLVANGDFTQGFAGWQLAPNKLPVILVGPPSTGYYTVRLGTQETTGVESYSSLRQPISIPAGPGQVLLQFWAWTWSEATAGTDHQEADFLAEDPIVLQKFWRTLRNDQAWVFYSFPVTSYAGRNIVLYFNVYNDGAGGRSAMFLDGVHMWVCPTAYGLAATGYNGVVAQAPTPTPEPTPEPTVTTAPPEAVAPPATVPPMMTVLSLVTTPTPTAPPAAPQPGLGIGGAAVLTPTATPAPGFFDRIGLHLPPLPPFWWLGLLAIIVVVLLIIVFLRGTPP